MAKPAEKKTAENDKGDAGAKPTFGEGVRETLDSIVIAFILAFLFRTFEAEAFVIPTGSMALTLMGAHKDHVCPECGTPYKVGASGENPERGRPDLVTSSMCPNCRYRHRYNMDERPPTYNGDRILVTKYSYDFAEPQRYDVAVFKNPSLAKQNYIKRLIGLPNEEVLIWHGDIYTRKLDEATGKPIEDAFRIARKPPEKALAVMQCVYDNDYVLPKLIERGWPSRWEGGVEGAPGPWKTTDLKTFATEGNVEGTAWLRYQHYVPSEEAWRAMDFGTLDPSQKAKFAKPQLITDFCEYNTYPHSVSDVTYLGLHWVGDLAIECELTFQQRPDNGEAVLQLSEGKHRFECRIAAKTGDVTLAMSDRDDFKPTAKGAVSGDGPHRLRFANVDDRLMLWVDDELVTFDKEPIFQSFKEALLYDTDDANYLMERMPIVDEAEAAPLENLAPTKFDLEAPVAIAAHNCGLSVAHLRVLRDVYYIADKGRMFENGAVTPASGRIIGGVSDYRRDAFEPFRTSGLTSRSPEETHRAFMSDVTSHPERWQEMAAVSFQLEKDRFFMLGDNSQQSLDGRLWRGLEDPQADYFVRRELLIGKALFVYWPHGWDNVPFTDIRLPKLWFLGNQYNPDFSRMRLIR
jgi:signal peptidase I